MPRHPTFPVLSTLILGLASLPVLAQGAFEMPPTQVEVTKPKQQPLADSIGAVGTLRAGEAITVKPEVAGRIEAVLFQEGQKVEKGAALFRLDASLARADLAENQANAANSQREARRADEMLARKLIAPADADTKKSQAKVDEAKLSSSRTRLDKTEIRAPFSGVAGLRKVSAGEYVDIGNPLVDLVQMDPLKLDFALPETQLGKIREGAKITITLDAYPKEQFEGTVYAVAPQVDQATRTVMLRAQLRNPDMRLRPGQFARVALETGRKDNALMIPEQALWPQGEQQNVYVVKDGKAELKPIKIGARTAGMVEVLEGLSVDDYVITAGQLKIEPGAKVAPAGGSSTPPAEKAAKK